jgi:hypothetical protein
MSLYYVWFGDGTKLRVRAMSPKHAWEIGQKIKEVARIQWIR